MSGCLFYDITLLLKYIELIKCIHMCMFIKRNKNC